MSHSRVRELHIRVSPSQGSVIGIPLMRTGKKPPVSGNSQKDSARILREFSCGYNRQHTVRNGQDLAGPDLCYLGRFPGFRA